MDFNERKEKLIKSLPIILIGAFACICLYVMIQGTKGVNNITSNNNFSSNNETVSCNLVDSSKNKDLISLVYSEAYGYGANAQQGVVSVIFNRLKSADFPNNIHDIIYQPGQFESVCAGNLIPYDSIPEGDRKSIECVIKNAQVSDNTCGAMFYYKPYQVNQNEDEQIRKMQGVSVIDDIVFMTTFPY